MNRCRLCCFRDGGVFTTNELQLLRAAYFRLISLSIEVRQNILDQDFRDLLSLYAERQASLKIFRDYTWGTRSIVAFPSGISVPNLQLLQIPDKAFDNFSFATFPPKLRSIYLTRLDNVGPAFIPYPILAEIKRHPVLTGMGSSSAGPRSVSKPVSLSFHKSTVYNFQEDMTFSSTIRLLHFQYYPISLILFHLLIGFRSLSTFFSTNH